MRVLGIESAALVASVAFVDEDTLIGAYTINYKITHSQTLLPMIDEMCRMLGIDIDSIDAIAVSGGPGSFTGLRIGAATAKGLGMALDKVLIHVPTLAAMAYQIFGTKALICPIMDARRNQVYTGVYRHRTQLEVVVEDRACGIDELVERLNKDFSGQSVIFLGDGVPVFRTFLEEYLQIKPQFAPAMLARQNGGAVATLGLEMFKRGEYISSDDMKPNYLRLSQAERWMAENKNI